MKLPNNPRVLASTYNTVSNTKMISFLVDFPTVLLAELRTHRILTQGSLYEHSELVDFNLSANSARAIPHNKYLQKVLDNPFIPIWTKQQKGMNGELLESSYLNNIWYQGLEEQVLYYHALLKENAHKQNANRLLAPFAYTTCIISGTEWDNFFELRCPKIYHEGTKKYYKSIKEWNKVDKDIKWNKNCLSHPENKSTAQPEFQVIAEMLYDLYQETEWRESEYHIPFENEIIDKYHSDICNYLKIKSNSNNWFKYDDYWTIIMKVSASMCAKLSYNTQDNEDSIEKHLERASMLIEHKHYEPFSHQAIAMNSKDIELFTKTFISSKSADELDSSYLWQGKYDDKNIWKQRGWCYNLRGFISQRYIIENY